MAALTRSDQSASPLQELLEIQAASGLVLIGAVALGLVVANSPLATFYFGALHAYVGPLNVQHWINDAFMAVFFLLVGLEIKREVLEGELASWDQRILPGVAALGGIVVPTLVFLALNWGNPETVRGWAIPAATDIAFALGVLALLGSRVPPSLKVFLTALAIIDDLGAVIIIALVYTSNISLLYLALAAAACALLVTMNLAGVTRLVFYLLVGALLWVFMLKSGVHATIAGVVLALSIPLRSAGVDHSPLHELEHALQPWVAFLVIPVFGFANAGVSFAGVTPGSVLNQLTLGIAAGLFVGKLVGVFGSAFLTIRLRLAEMPPRASVPQLLGISLLCGIGFTMSLFIGALCFGEDGGLQDAVKIGVLAGSVLAGVLGWLTLRLAQRDAAAPLPALESSGPTKVS
ncbi:MAG: Na+/H+ antiporter NhaA [Acetobacteraceae bacterium]|nr:Na+/H+ antiporter NhaA [Acetobacteraceae bacterium]